MEVKNLDVQLFNKAYRFAEETGVVPQNATDSEVSALLEIADDKKAVSQFIQLCKESLLPPFFGYKILNNDENLFLCTLLVKEDCRYTLDEWYPGCGRCDKALVSEIVSCNCNEQKDEVESLFMGKKTVYKRGEYVVADKFDVDTLECGIHFFPTKSQALHLSRQYKTNIACGVKSHDNKLGFGFQDKRQKILNISDMPELVRRIRDHSHSLWSLGATHGIEHWDRVYLNGQKLLTPDVNPLVVSLFAYLHDSCRVDDGKDIDHGKRASVRIDNLRNIVLREVHDEEIELLKEACSLHTITPKTGNPTIDACFDADRLDLWRIGIIPDPQKMATEKGKEIAQNEYSGSIISDSKIYTGYWAI